VAGERRARYLYTDGDPDELAGPWRDELGGGFLVTTRDEAISAGWFGPTVREEMKPLIGDVIACAMGSGAHLRSFGEPDSLRPGTRGPMSETVIVSYH